MRGEGSREEESGSRKRILGKHGEVAKLEVGRGGEKGRHGRLKHI